MKITKNEAYESQYDGGHDSSLPADGAAEAGCRARLVARVHVQSSIPQSSKTLAKRARCRERWRRPMPALRRVRALLRRLRVRWRWRMLLADSHVGQEARANERGEEVHGRLH